SKKAIDPVRAADPPLFAVTLAVSVSGWPTTSEVGASVRFTLVSAGLTRSVKLLDVADVWLASPGYVIKQLWLPGTSAETLNCTWPLEDRISVAIVFPRSSMRLAVPVNGTDVGMSDLKVVESVNDLPKV